MSPARLLPIALLLAAAMSAPAADSPRICVDAAAHAFTLAGHPFVPLGVSYYRPGTGWPPQLWKTFDAEATRRDFAILRRMGLNTVRVFITYGSFLTVPDALDPAGLAAFDRLLDLADEAGLHVHPTGPEGWEGMPAWTAKVGDLGSDDANEGCLQALEGFWRLFAARYRRRATIWAYDLRNEPVVAWDTPSARVRWAAWRGARGLPAAALPDPAARPAADTLLEYQHFRESLAEAWVARQAQAIHTADPGALVGVGLLQWSVPAQRVAPQQYSGFRPAAIARHLDFLELHYYPLATGAYRYEGEAAETAQLATLEAMARECAKPGLPLVIGEFGWYGGGALDAHGPPGSEAQQARWCTCLIEVTAPLACGWLNWGMYDHPQAGDVSRFTGLLTADGADKAWGRGFAALAQRFAAAPPVFTLPRRPDLPWDACVIDSAAGEAFRVRYLEAFVSDRGR